MVYVLFFHSIFCFKKLLEFQNFNKIYKKKKKQCYKIYKGFRNLKIIIKKITSLNL